MKDNIKCKLIDVALAGENISLSYDRHGKWVIYNSSATYDRVIFRWEGKRDDRPMESLTVSPIPLKDALDMVDANWHCRLVQYSAEVYR